MLGTCQYMTYDICPGGRIDAPKLAYCPVGAVAGAMVRSPRRPDPIPHTPDRDAADAAARQSGCALPHGTPTAAEDWSGVEP